MTRHSLSDIPQADWDALLLLLNGHFLQSYRWGEFKARHGWSVRRVTTGGSEPAGMAQVFFRRKGPVSAAYIPRGPAWNGSPQVLQELFTEIDRVCQQERTVLLVVESNAELPAAFLNQATNRYPGSSHAQPVRTVKVPLLEDEALLMQMRSKMRAQIRQAFRRGTTVIAAEGAHDPLFVNFYEMLQDTSDRNEFGVHPAQYYEDFLDIMGSDAALLIGRIDDQPVAGNIVVRFGKESIYLYGASSTTMRSGGSTAALQFASMQWGRNNGASLYDLWGIPARGPEKNPPQPLRSKGENMIGLFRFKTGFGGAIVTYPPTLQREYSRIGAFLANRFAAARSAE